MCGPYFATSTLSQTQYEHLLDLMLSHTAQLDAHAEYGRSDGQGLFVTVWGTGCYLIHRHEHFDARGTLGREPGWILYFTLAPQEMGRTAGQKGEFVAPVGRRFGSTKVKQSVTGSGNATKEQVAHMLRQTLTLPPIEEASKFLDATDALGVALCHHYQKGNNVKAGGKSWGKFLADNPGKLAAPVAGKKVATTRKKPAA